MKIGKPKDTWLEAAMENGRKVGLNESYANKRERWRLGVDTISIKLM